MKHLSSLLHGIRIAMLYMAVASLPALYGEDSEWHNEEVGRALIGNAKTSVYRTIEKQWYRDAETQVDLRLYVFEPDDLQAGDRRPAALFIHGGAWRTGHPSKGALLCEYLASRGMVAISVQYRLTRAHKVTPFECADDVRAAMRWVRRHADSLHINPDKIVAIGSSAGGHLAGCLAFLLDTGDDAGGDAVSIIPDALVLYCPVIDVTESGYRNGHNVLGERYLELSPAQHVTPDAPPVIIMSGTRDGSSPMRALEAFQERMLAAGNQCELVKYEGVKHGVTGTPENFIDVTWRTDRFLESLGYLQDEVSKEQTAQIVQALVASSQSKS